jgi:peptidoglycan/LPS O-acetylase OafA/YrhL
MTSRLGLPYRPELDGLRAIAVLSVVVYHVSPEWLPGGFLGVDIFFVISGFLIGGIVLNSIGEGSFTFRDFYWRRFRRLAPALFLVLGVTALIATAFYSSNELARFGSYLIAAVFGVSNMRFIFDPPYEVVEAGINPLLHTWSLGVEEQFYLLMPLLLWLVTGRKRPRVLFPLLVVLFIASFILSLVIPGLISNQANFFGLPSRAWELVAGVALAAVRPRGFTKISERGQDFVSLIGIGAIGCSLIFLDVLSTGPSQWTLLPVAGSLLVIGATRGVVARTLSRRIPVFVGLVSYPFYLWHFPALAFGEILFGPLPPEYNLALAGFAFLLATGTYLWIEKPIRFWLPPRRWVPSMAALVSLTTVAAIFFMTAGGLPFRFSGMPAVVYPKSDDGPRDWVTEGSGRTVILVGDSQMRTLTGSLIEEARAEGFRFSSYTEVGCQLLIGLEKADKITGQTEPGCDADVQAKRLEWINSHGPSVIILGGRLPLILHGDRFDNLEGGYEGDYSDYFRLPETAEYDSERSSQEITESYRQTVQLLLEHGHHVVLVYPIPEAGWHVPNMLARRTLLNGLKWPIPDKLTTSYEVFLDRTATAYALLDSFKEEAVIRVYPELLFCNVVEAGRCSTHSDDEIYYADEHHPSLAGAQVIVRQILSELAPISPDAAGKGGVSAPLIE